MEHLGINNRWMTNETLDLIVVESARKCLTRKPRPLRFSVRTLEPDSEGNENRCLIQPYTVGGPLVGIATLEVETRFSLSTHALFLGPYPKPLSSVPG